MSTPVIQTKRLRKEYKELVAVRGLDLELHAGDIFGFIGPNGAGKTTTIKMLATLLQPTSGTATVDGVDVVQHPEHVRGHVGYMPDFIGVYDDIKVWEYLEFFAAAYRIPRHKREAIIDDVLGLTDLTVKKDAYVESLSRGMKQRLCLAKTLVHDPKVLLLDEPASGLDPRARIEIKELIKELGSMGKTIIVSSHILPELADFCNKIGIIEKGELIVAGDVNEIIRQTRGGYVIEVRLAVGGSPVDRTQELGAEAAGNLTDPDIALEVLEGLPNVSEPRIAQGVLLFGFTGEPGAEWEILRSLVMANIRVVSFGPQATDLEDVFLSVTKGIVS